MIQGKISVENELDHKDDLIKQKHLLLRSRYNKLSTDEAAKTAVA